MLDVVCAPRPFVALTLALVDRLAQPRPLEPTTRDIWFKNVIGGPVHAISALYRAMLVEMMQEGLVDEPAQQYCPGCKKELVVCYETVPVCVTVPCVSTARTSRAAAINHISPRIASQRTHDADHRHALGVCAMREHGVGGRREMREQRVHGAPRVPVDSLARRSWGCFSIVGVGGRV